MNFTKLNYTRFLMLFFLSILTIFYVSCDMEKFIDSNYDATPLPKTAKIYGTVFNIFDNIPVYDAQVMIDSQATSTDTSGSYYLDYNLGLDEVRDKPVPICITAPKYMEYNSTSIIYPINKIDFYIDYGAPIIQKIARDDIFCQAIILDYQGYENIDSVVARFFYRPPGQPVPITIMEFTMDSKESDSTNIGFFQCYVPLEIFYPVYLIINRSFYIIAYDKSGFIDSTSYARSGVDTLLFPIF